MPGAFVLGLELSGAAGSTDFVDVSGKTVTAGGGVTIVTATGASGDSALQITTDGHVLSVGSSLDFVLDGECAIGLAISPVNTYNQGVLLKFVSYGGATIYRDSAGAVILSSPMGIVSAGVAPAGARSVVLFSRDASGAMRAFRGGALQDVVDGYSGALGGATWPSAPAVDIAGGNYRGLIDDVFIVSGDPLHTEDYTPTLGLPDMAGGGDTGPAPTSSVIELRIAATVATPAPLSVGIDAVISDGRAMDADAVLWSLRVILAGIDISNRLTGEVEIEAGEDSARIASIDFIPIDAAQLMSAEGQRITVDAIVSGGGYSTIRRRFTGFVESIYFAASSRVASLRCRDGYQDTIRAAASANAVRALLGGLDTVSARLVAWSDDEPDPVGYFRAALDTVPGATFVDGLGIWRVKKWDIGSPARVYTEDDIFDPGPQLTTPARADMPDRITATLSHRFYRLHNVEAQLSYSRPSVVDFVRRGVFHPQKSMVAQALENLGDWLVKGQPELVSPAPGVYSVPGATELYYIVPHESANLLLDEMYAVVYRRWYQEVTRKYVISIDLGGSGERDESIGYSVRSDWDAAGWERGRKSEPSIGIYAKNAPPGSVATPELTGYEALEAPWPPTNGAMDHSPGLGADEVDLAVRHVVAIALRKAASSRRQQRVTFERPVDLRLEIGDVVGVDAYGVSATGQVMDYREMYDHETAAVVGSYVLACPAGDGAVTQFDVTPEVTDPVYLHIVTPPALQNWIGADSNTPDAWINPASMAGYFANTLGGLANQLESEFYDGNAPVYETQFRIVMPEISALLRDPLTDTVDLPAVIEIAGSGVTVNF